MAVTAPAMAVTAPAIAVTALATRRAGLAGSPGGAVVSDSRPHVPRLGVATAKSRDRPRSLRGVPAGRAGGRFAASGDGCAEVDHEETAERVGEGLGHAEAVVVQREHHA